MKIKIAVMPLLLFLFAGQAWSAEKQAVLDWSQRFELATAVSGVVKTVHVDVGDKVSKGQLLLALDRREARARIQSAKGKLDRAQEVYDEAKRELERGNELFERDAISVHEHQLVKIEYTKADSALREAKAALRINQLHHDYGFLRSPVNGVIVQRRVQPQQLVVTRLQARPFLVVAANANMIVRAHLTTEEIQGLSSGTPITVKVQGKVLQGQIHSLGQEPVAANNKALYALEVLIANQNGIYRKGMAATIMLP